MASATMASSLKRCIEMDEEVVVKFTDVKWPEGSSHPSVFEKKVRTVFLKDRDGVLFGYNDMKAVLMAWLQDETGACPDSLDFSLAFEGK